MLTSALKGHLLKSLKKKFCLWIDAFKTLKLEKVSFLHKTYQLFLGLNMFLDPISIPTFRFSPSILYRDQKYI